MSASDLSDGMRIFHWQIDLFWLDLGGVHLGSSKLFCGFSSAETYPNPRLWRSQWHQKSLSSWMWGPGDPWAASSPTPTFEATEPRHSRTVLRDAQWARCVTFLTRPFSRIWDCNFDVPGFCLYWSTVSVLVPLRNDPKARSANFALCDSVRHFETWQRQRYSQPRLILGPDADAGGSREKFLLELC